MIDGGRTNKTSQFPSILSVTSASGAEPGGDDTIVDPLSHTYIFKFILIGDSGSGKSCLLHYFLERRFKDDQKQTIGVEFGCKIINYQENKKIKLQLWDTAGLERYRAVSKSYYRHAIGCMLLYDVNDRKTFEHLTEWLDDVQSLARSDICICVVGNKVDSDKGRRQVSLLEASEFAQKHGCLFMETSARTGENVDEAFSAVLHRILQRIDSANAAAARSGGGGTGHHHAHPPRRPSGSGSGATPNANHRQQRSAKSEG